MHYIELLRITNAEIRIFIYHNLDCIALHIFIGHFQIDKERKYEARTTICSEFLPK